MSVRAKFKVSRVEATLSTKGHSENGTWIVEGAEELRTIVLVPVYDPEPGSENHTFWQATPSGQIMLGTVNPAAWQQFELGEEFYIDFTPAKQ